MMHDLRMLAEQSMPGEHAVLRWQRHNIGVYEVVDTGERLTHCSVDLIRPDHDGLYPLGARTWPWLTFQARE
jgi:hypothetical protein